MKKRFVAVRGTSFTAGKIPASSTARTWERHDTFAILKTGTTYPRGSPFLSSNHVFFSFLVRNELNAGWFLVNSHYKCLCASLCTFETVQKIEVG